MSLDTLLGSVLMVAPPEGWLDGSTEWLDELQPAGVILFKRNLPPDADAARAGIARLQAWAAARGETLLVAMDEEGGFVTQTNLYMPTPPSARALAWGGDPEATRRVFAAHGRRLRALGVNIDFAPVCDVNNNAQNPVIGVRAFGSEAALVSEYARSVHAGLADAGVLSCAKHFPGHGDTDVDSHLALPIVQHDRKRFDALELVPFRALLAHVPVVMVAHLACPELGDGALPATLSHRITTDLLRDELGFTGVATTDAMDMQGVSGSYGVAEAAVRAMRAGCDLLLYCFEIDKPLEARAGLRRALESGELSQKRLEEASRRVERLRALAAAGSDVRTAAEPLPPAAEDAALYRRICDGAVRISNEEGWREFTHAVRQGGCVDLCGWNDETLERFAAKLRQSGIAVEVRAVCDTAGSPQIVVLAERRPLTPERVAELRRCGATLPHAVLANLLTPEVDSPVASAFATRLRSADSSDAMLEALVRRIVAT